ncbi:N-formylglutamate amidohydrolase [Pseudovibrio axinellae]|uniref:N-formylglutamate amidohydrolase n=1 Tax=Pseudovibrio axinellae TaxID=989403 RepID=A0A165VT99_9HYPH|nr:N-formylglutamate amidohydrolase [Pseudovibrio axinellae]KZL15411.1 N-formylglutamate amidohydrolase [Pseudovibrio axinellae]SER55318.1 Predicted N-formylglutamate amidohydrolase [Pseudovibrio axinellae]
MSQVSNDPIDSAVGNTVETINTAGSAPIVLVCEHASKAIPAYLNGLGLDKAAAESHAAWDPGALAVAQMLSARLDAPLVAQRISRLVYDCNRPPEADSAMPVKSEIYEVPGNVSLSDEQRADRINRYYLPFQACVRDTIDAKQVSGQLPVMITIHSFTPVYNGKTRDVELGILHDSDTRFAEALLEVLSRSSQYDIQRNQPYGPEDGVTHTLVSLAQSRGLLNVMIEVRNDLIADRSGQETVAKVIGDAVLQVLPQFENETTAHEPRAFTKTRAAD